MARKPSLALRVLTTVADADVHDAIWWQTTDSGRGQIQFYVNCSELFELGSVDLEPITGDNIDAFEAAISDASRTTEGDATYGPHLFAARQRGTRPESNAYPTDKRLWPLFDACGPERDLNLGGLRRLRNSTAEAVAVIFGPALIPADAPVPQHDCAVAVDATGTCIACGNPNPAPIGPVAELADATPPTDKEPT